MLGLTGFSVFLAYLLLLLTTAFGIVYGIMYWNKDGEISESELQAEKDWMKEEIEIDEELIGGDA
ncbi:MAG: hypothetical protein JW982_05685 [Spirochaetes bacterium]|nr:hypothetical protein [Spirochaetota bacterium]